MVASKRKENPNSELQAGSTPKKPKKEEKRAKNSKHVQDLETATDSDPLVESDTTSHSGDDDGVSWPSDEEAEEGEGWEGVGVAEDNDVGGVNIAAEAAGASQPGSKAASTNGNPTKTDVKLEFALAEPFISKFLERIPFKAKSRKTRTQGGQT